MKSVPRPFFLALTAYAIVLAVFVALTLSDAPIVKALTVLAALGTTGFVAILLVRAIFAEDQPSAPVKLDTGLLVLPEHLRVSETGRGFAHFPSLPNKYGGPEDITVHEASNAEYAGIWLTVRGIGANGEYAAEATANLTAGTAWRLAEQLALLVANHYHGDQRPDSNETVLSVASLPQVFERPEVDA